MNAEGDVRGSQSLESVDMNEPQEVLNKSKVEVRSNPSVSYNVKESIKEVDESEN